MSASGNHSYVGLQEAQQLEPRHQLELAGMGHWLLKPPFQRHLTFSCEICLAFPSRCPSSSCHQQAGKAISTSGRGTWPLLLTGTRLAKATGKLGDGVQAAIHSDSCQSSGGPSRRGSFSPGLAVPLSRSVAVALTLNPQMTLRLHGREVKPCLPRRTLWRAPLPKPSFPLMVSEPGAGSSESHSLPRGSQWPVSPPASEHHPAGPALGSAFLMSARVLFDTGFRSGLFSVGIHPCS